MTDLPSPRRRDRDRPADRPVVVDPDVGPVQRALGALMAVAVGALGVFVIRGARAGVMLGEPVVEPYQVPLLVVGVMFVAMGAGGLTYWLAGRTRIGNVVGAILTRLFPAIGGAAFLSVAMAESPDIRRAISISRGRSGLVDGLPGPDPPVPPEIRVDGLGDLVFGAVGIVLILVSVHLLVRLARSWRSAAAVLVVAMGLPACANPHGPIEQEPLPPVLATAAFVADRAMEHRGFDTRGLVRVAEALADLGEPELAVRVLARAVTAAGRIDDENLRYNDYYRIAAAYARAGHVESARQVLGWVPDTWPSRFEGALTVASALREAGREEEARQLLAEGAEWVARQDRPTNRALPRLATAQRQAGDPEAADRLLQRALGAAAAEPTEQGRSQDRRFIAAEFARLGRDDRAYEVAALIEDANTRGGALFAIARYHVEAGRPDQALDALPHFEPIGGSQLAESRRDYWSSYVRAEAAAAMAARGRLDDAAAVIAHLDNRYFRMRALFAVGAAALAEPASRSAAGSMLAQALDLAEASAPGTRAIVLTNAAPDLHQAGDTDRALAYLDLARLAARTLPRGPERARTMERVATRYADIGRFDRALETADEMRLRADEARVHIAGRQGEAGQFVAALETTRRIRSPTQRTIALTRLALLHADAGHQPSAQELATLEEIRRDADRTRTRWRALRVLDFLF